MMEKEQEKEKKTNAEDEAAKELIRELGLLSTGAGFDSDLQYISIIGSIEGHSVLPADNKTTKYEHLIPQLIAVEENPALKGLLVVLNTVGGDVEAGLALAEMISTISKPTVSLVLGGGHSIGIRAGRGYGLFIYSSYSHHDAPSDQNDRNSHHFRNHLRLYGEKTQERVVDFITGHSRAKREEIVRLMNCNDNMSNDVGTVLFGREAVETGIIDKVGGLSQAIGELRKRIG